MSSIPFMIPYINQRVDIPVSQQRIADMNQHTQQVRSANPDGFEQMKETVKKITPIATAIIAALILTPIWLPIASISSYLLGPIAWIVAGVVGSCVNQMAKRIMSEFDRQCPDLVNYAAAVLVNCQQGDDAVPGSIPLSQSPDGFRGNTNILFERAVSSVQALNPRFSPGL